MNENYITVEEAAKRLNISVRTVYRRLADGTLTKYHFPKRPRTPLLSVEEVEAIDQPIEKEQQ